MSFLTEPAAEQRGRIWLGWPACMFLAMPACLQSNEEIQCELLKVKMRMNRNELVDIVQNVFGFLYSPTTMMDGTITIVMHCG